MRGFSVEPSSRILGHVRAVPAVACHDLAARLRVDAERAVARRLREQLLRPLARQLVRRHVLRHARPLVAALQVRAVPADAHDDVRARDLDRVDLARVDLVEVVGDERVQALLVAASAVEAAEPVDPVLVALGDPVEVVLHARREVVVDEAAEVLLEQLRDGEREERRHERRALLEHVATVEDRPQDRRVRRRAPDAPVLERLHERRLGVAGRRVRRVPLGDERGRRERLSGGQGRQAALVLCGRRRLLVAALLVRGEEAAERDHRARRRELGVPAVG